MSELEKRINGLLSDPEALSGIINLVKGLGPLSSTLTNTVPQEAETTIQAEGKQVNNQSQSVQAGSYNVYQNHTNDFISEKSIGLLLALKPFLSDYRCEKIDIITKLLKVATLTELLK